MKPSNIQPIANCCALLSKRAIKAKLVIMPSGPTIYSKGVLNGLSRFGSLKRKINTARHTIAKANKVPKLVISLKIPIGVKDATNETTKPTSKVLFQGV